MLYHVRIGTKSMTRADHIRLDLTAEELEDRFLKPYREGRPIVIGGVTVPMSDLARIRINQSTMNASQILPIVKKQRATSAIVSTISNDWYIASYGDEVTDKFIDSPPGQSSLGMGEMDNPEEGNSVPDAKRVFVVHGRNMKARDAIFTFLRTLGLSPVEWIEAVDATGKPAPYVGEILDVAFAQAAAILVLMTPDDEAHLKEEYREAHEPTHETSLTGQARPNVLFEAGMAMGRNEGRTILVEIGNLRPFSDIGGRLIVRINNTTQRRQELAQRLQSAGCAVSTSGVDWHSAGDFDSCL